MKYKGQIKAESKTPTRSLKRKKTIEERLTPLSQKLILGLTVVVLMVSMLAANKAMGVDVENGSLDPRVFFKNKQLEEAKENQSLEAKETFVRNVPAYEGLTYEYSYYQGGLLFDRYVDDTGQEVLYQVEE